MSIIPASRLSHSELSRLGNNLGPPRRPVARSAQVFHRRIVAAVNRSLANLGEKVSDLDPMGELTPAGGGRGF